jgi:hypothetical protein
MTGQIDHTIMSSDDTSSVSSYSSMISYNECVDRNNQDNDYDNDDLNNKSNHSNSSISSFLSTLLNNSANECGGTIQDLKICIVQDNATSEHQHTNKKNKLPIKLVKLERSTSTYRMCRWGGGGNSSEGGGGSKSSNNKSALTQRQRHQSDPCLVELKNKKKKNQILKVPARKRTSHLSPQQEPKIRTRPSMKSSASDSSLLRMPLRTESPRITKYTMNSSGRSKRESSPCNSTSSSSSTSQNAKWNTSSAAPGGKSTSTTSNDLFQQLASTLPYPSSTSTTPPAASMMNLRSSNLSNAGLLVTTAAGMSKSASSGGMLGREQKRRTHHNYPPLSASAMLHQQDRGAGLGGLGGSSPSLDGMNKNQSLSASTGSSTTTTSAIRNPALMGLDLQKTTLRGGGGYESSAATNTSPNNNNRGGGGLAGRKCSPQSGPQERKTSVIKDPSALGLKLPSSSRSTPTGSLKRQPTR